MNNQETNITKNKDIIDNNGNKILSATPLPRNVNIKFNGKENTIIIKENFQTSSLSINFEGNNALLEIGKSCRVNGTIRISTDCSLKIGNFLLSIYPNRYFIGEKTTLVIGEDCMFSGGIIFRTEDAHAIYDVATGKRINKGKDITIGNHVWICEDCKILKGTEIDLGSIVAMGALLSNCRIVNNAIVGGNPWRYLKYNIAWEKPYVNNPLFQESSKKSKYWQMSKLTEPGVTLAKDK